MDYKMTAEAATARGKRDENQDNFCIDTVIPYVEKDCSEKHVFDKKDEKFHLVCVCDGIGGGACGDMAAVSALEGIGDMLKKQNEKETAKDFLFQLAEAADQNVKKMLKTMKSRGGTTLAMLVWRETEFYAVNAGDSPVYLLRKHRLYRLSEAHTLKNWKLARGLEVSEADRHTLINYLGRADVRGRDMISILHGDLRHGDIFLICSDGVTNELKEEEIISGLLEDTENRAEKIVERAVAAGGNDNCTAVVLSAENASDQELFR